jgi:hypothetical protein
MAVAGCRSTECRLPIVDCIVDCRLRWCLAAAVLLAACGSPTSATPTTGLTGTVLRGPITPVCTTNSACDAPFSAGFTVARGGVTVAHFRSDNDGRFTVMLAPGAYRVIPDADAPIISPTSQVKAVTVDDVGLTTVTLEFDTGIR